MLARLFHRQRVVTPKWRSRPARGKTRLDIQALESRLALAVSASPVVLTTTPATFGWNIVIDDAVDSQGYGRDLYMRRGDDASPYALISDNPEFRDAQRLALLTTFGPATTFYVTTGGQQSRVEGSLQPSPGQLLVLKPSTGTYTLDLPKANPLAISGTVTVASGVSFTYSGAGLQANRLNALTLTVNNANNWASAGLNTSPTGRITTINGISTLTFNVFDTNNAPIDTQVFELINAPYLYFNPFPTQPFSFNVVAGQEFDQRLIVDLAGSGSRISLQSPWSAALGDDSGDVDGVDRDPAFYRAYSGLNAKGQVCAYASEVSVSQLLSATSVIDVGDARAVSERVTMAGDLVRGSLVISNLPASKITDISLNDFVSGPGIPKGTQVTFIDTLNSEVTLSSACGVNATTASLSFTSARYSGYVGLPYSFSVAAEMRAPALNVLMSGNEDRDGTLAVAQSGRFTRDTDGRAADAVTVRASDTDVYLEGWVNALSQNYILGSTDAERQFDFTTRSRTTGATVGTIGGKTLAVNLGSLGGTTFDVRTQVDEIRIDSGIDLQGRPYRNAITVSEVTAAANLSGDGKLKVTAVAASSGAITIATDSDLEFLGASIRTSGDVNVDCGGALTLPGTVTSGNGDIAIRGPTLAATSVASGGARSTNLIAGQSTRAATRSATTFGSTSLSMVSTARLAIGMAVSGPGIAAGTRITRVDAVNRLVTLSVPTTTASTSGAVMTFVSNEGDAIVDAAVRAGGGVKDQVRVATNMALPALSGLLTVDGIVVAAGDRVLVKNQTKAAQNGIYIASLGPWQRAADAALSTQFVPGFVVFAEDGQTQEGGWCFSNSANPIVGETGLMFEAVTATQTYSPVRLATTGNLSLFGTASLVDGRPVNVGDRILVKDQSNRAENGIYVVTAGRWERADQADELAELTAGSYVAVQRAGIALGATLTAASNVITLVTASTADVRVGMLAEGVGIPAGTVVTSVATPNLITLSQSVTATTGSSVTFTAPVVTDAGLAGNVSLNGDLVLTSRSVTNVSGANGLTADATQVGMVVTGSGVTPGTTVTAVNNATQITLSNLPTVTTVGVALTFTANTTESGSKIVGGLQSTAALRPGMIVVGLNVPGGAQITRVLNAATVEISQPATGTAAGTQLSFYEPGGVANAGRAFALANNVVQVGATQLQFDPFMVQATRINFWSPQQVDSKVRVATSADVSLTGLQVIDGVAVQAGDRILVKNQRNPAQNGIWLAQSSAWIRAAGGLPRGVSIFVEDGASGSGSTWLMNDTVRVMGQLTSGTLIVRGITSTAGLIAGMLVMGPGIQTGTSIDLVIDTNSIRLSKPPLTTEPNAILSFMGIGQVVPGVTPLTFVPAGGDVSVTAAGSILSASALPTSRLQGSTCLLTAGRLPDGQVATAGAIDARVTTGRVSATSPESIGIDAAGTLDVIDVRTTTSGGVVIAAENTLVARSVITASTSATPSPITLKSTLGDVVATAVTTPLGDILLRADGDGSIFIANGGAFSPGVAAQSGSIDVITDNGLIQVAGKISAAGTGSDVVFRSSTNALNLLSTADVSVSDQLVVVTPFGQLQIQPGAVVAANRLAITAQFGVSQGPAAALGSFSAIEINRTDPGNIVLSSPVALTVEGATAVLGNISLTAPSLQVIGNVTAATAAPGDGTVQLTATAGNIALAAPVTALGDRVTLNASSGAITQTAGQIDSQTLVWYATTSPLPGLAGTFVRVGSNLTGPGSLSLGTPTAPIVIVGASTMSGSIAITGSSVRIVDTVKANAGDPVSITAANGNIEFAANTLAGIVTIPAGPINLSAVSGAVIAANKATRTTVRGGPLTVVAQTADLKCNVTSLTSTTTFGGLTASAVGGLTLAGITAAGQSVTLDAVSGVSQASGGIVANALSVTNGSGPVSLTSTTNAVTSVSINNSNGNVAFTNAGAFTVAAPGISAGTVSPGDGDISLKSVGGNIGLNANVTAGGDRVTLNATAGTITQLPPSQVNSQTFVWYAQTQPVVNYSAQDIGLNITSNSYSSLSIPVTPTQRVLRSSTVNGPITITGPSVFICEPVTAGGADSGVTVTATTGSITLQPFNGSTPSIISTGGSVNLSATSGQIDAQYGIVSGNSITSTSAGTVFVGTIQAANTMSIVTTAGGGVSVGPQAGALLQAGSTLDLSQVQGQIRIRNAGRILGNPLVLGGKTISFGGAITTVAELNNVVNAVNSLPVVPGSPYEILIGASMTLTQTLTVTRPVTFRGTSSSMTLFGTSSVPNGLALTGSAAGSTVRDLAFSNFSGRAVQATSLSGITIRGVKVSNSGTGIALSSVTSSMIGGTAAGEGNVLQNCSREGIYATGICTNTQLVKNTFPGTTTKYNVSSSRGITVVN